MIQAIGLTKDYGLHRAVDHVSFRIDHGDIVGLLGPNGSGKTTIMRMLTGFFAPTDGSCAIAGVDVERAPREARRHVGYLPERVALYPDLTVSSYLSFMARVRGVTGRISDYTEEAMQRCGLADMADCHIGKLSRGYRQRVGIAQAVIHKPEVLILDEPTVGLDPRQIIEIRSLIRKLAGHTTVLLSTHILPEVSISCRRILILDKGRLVAEDTAESLSRKTAGRGQTRIRVAAPEAEAVEVLGGCRGVKGIEVAERDRDGVIALVVTAERGADVRAELARVAVGQGWPLYEISPCLTSLEDLFVEILEHSSEASV